MTEISPFEYVKSVSETGKRIDDLSGYNPFMINRALSLNIDCLVDSNIINIFHNLPINMQYDYYLNSIRKSKRYGKKWPKPENNADIEVIMQFYNFSKQKAKVAATILTDSDIEFIREKLDKGGVTK